MEQTIKYPVIDLKATGKNIKALMKAKGTSASKLQEILGFSTPQAIYKWQWGQTLPDVTNLLVLSSLWNVRVEDILILED